MSVLDLASADERILERFRCFLKNSRLAHAYLFIGPAGSGKFSTALAVAAMAQCSAGEGRPCGRCASCLRVLAGNHPDVGVCVPEADGESIRIDAVREMVRGTQMRPYESDRKIMIVRGADRMTTEAANAFLKTLEEPSGNSLIILTAVSSDRLLDTIKSRCQMLYFTGSSGRRVSERLVEESGVDPDEARLAAGFAEGSCRKAGALREDGFLQWKNEVMDRFLEGTADENFFKSLLADSGKTRSALEALFFCFRDLMVLRAGDGSRLVNSDRLTDLQAWSARYSIGRLGEIVKGIVNAKRMLDEKLNIKVPFMLLQEMIWNRH